MTQKTHLQILQHAQWFILLFTLLVGIAAFAWAVVQPTKYNAVVAFDVQVANRGAADKEYQYGAYYDLKGAEVFTQHLMSWFLSPSFVEDVYKSADMGYEIKSVNAFTGRFQTKQYSSQQFAVLFYDYNKETAEKLATAVAKTVEEKSLSQIQTDQQTQFNVKAQNPVVVASELNQWIALIVGFIAGLALSVIVVYIREYLRAGKNA